MGLLLDKLNTTGERVTYARIRDYSYSKSNPNCTLRLYSTYADRKQDIMNFKHSDVVSFVDRIHGNVTLEKKIEEFEIYSILTEKISNELIEYSDRHTILTSYQVNFDKKNIGFEVTIYASEEAYKKGYEAVGYKVFVLKFEDIDYNSEDDDFVKYLYDVVKKREGYETSSDLK